MQTFQSPGRRVTSTDVAREVGLSRTTVSYVLNDTPHQKIPDSTRRRVLDAAKRLGYAPSAAARTLRSGRSDVVLCLLPNWPIGVVLGRMLEELSSELGRRGLTLLTHPGDGQERVVSHVLSAVTPAAVITFEPFQPADLAVIRGAAIPATLELADRPGRNRIRSVDQRQVGRLQAEHLAATGHRRLGYAFPDDGRLGAFSTPRLEGVQAACAELGLKPPVIRTVALDTEQAAAAAKEWVDLDPRVTGICAYNDEVAFALLAGMRRQGLRAPDDLAVIGVDDIPTAGVADPPLTTVVMDVDVVARHAAEAVARALAGKSLPRNPRETLAHLVLRESA